MISGNLPPEETIKMDYLDYSKPPFGQTKAEKRIILRPHQTKSLIDLNKQYQPLDLECPTQEIDCICLRDDSSNIFDKLIDSTGIQATLLWLDPCFLKTECLASIIINWKKRVKATQNVAIAIVVPEGDTDNITNSCYELWKADISGPSYGIKVKNPIWYPSLARDSKSLEHASQILDLYDTFPLIEFPQLVTQMGEQALTNHAFLLEQCRTRTRNFIYLDILHPDRAFKQLYETLRAIPKIGPSVFQPVITPGGSCNGFLISLLSGILAETCFLTPKEEILIDSNAEAQGIIILRKCT